jgi:hypothetical protein
LTQGDVVKVKLIAALAALAVGLTGTFGFAPSVEAAKKKTYKVVKIVKVVKKKKKVVVYKPAPVGASANVQIVGGGIKKGGPGTEAKSRAAAIADWQRQATGRFGAAYGNYGKATGTSTTCKRDVISVRCLAYGSPCR